jgi:serine/threonine protein kinase
MLTVNQVLQQGRYRILDGFVQNGIGAAYKAYDTVLETNVVLRETRVDLSKVTTFAQMETLKSAFANDAKILTGLKHGSLVQIHNYFAEVNRQYLVTEHVDGEFLSDLLEHKRAFSVADAMTIAVQLLDALGYLHTRAPSIIHRDIKPQNIKLTAGGEAKLLIFNVGDDADAKAKIDFANPSFDTANLPYLPLEQIWDGLDAASQHVIRNGLDEKSQQMLEQPADARSDIYSLGAALYHLFTARRPIDALERSIEMLDGKPDPLPPASAINPEIPSEISAALTRAMEIKREDRFSSAAGMRHAFTAAPPEIGERILPNASSQIEETNAPQPIEFEAIELENNAAQALEFEDDDAPQLIEVEDDDALLEIAFAEKAPEPKLISEDQKAEAEKARQLELMQQQLREAEAQRLLAEHRAAEAEKRLLEKEAAPVGEIEIPAWEEPAENFEEDFDDETPVSSTVVLFDEFEEEAVSSDSEAPVEAAEPEEFENFDEAPVSSTVAIFDEYEPETSPVESPKPVEAEQELELFASPQKENKSMKKIAAVVAVLVILGGAAWGVWMYLQSQQAVQNHAVSSEQNNPAVSVQTAITPAVEPSPEASALPETSPESVEDLASSPVKNNKAAQPSPTPAKKPAASPAKTPAPKKAVTVDDLINDN